jgi:hypothetical protein
MGKDITLKEYVKILDRTINNISEATKKINKELDKQYETDIKYLMDKAVQEFYDDYTELRAYKRKYDLFNAYKVSVKGLNLSIQTGAKFMKKRHKASNDYIYNMAFVSGWHGGAPYINDVEDSVWGVPHPNPAKYIGGDTPIEGGDLYWRTPMKPKDIRYSQWYSTPAPQASIAPLDRIKELLEDYCNNGYKGTLDKAIENGLKKIL